MTVDQIVGGTLWIQLMILQAAIVFAIFEMAFCLTGQRRSFLNRRRIGVATIASLAVLPLVKPYLEAVPLAAHVNVTEVAVAQVLKGNLAISASEMTGFLSMKHEVLEQVLRADSLLVQVAIAVFVAVVLARALHLMVNVIRILSAIRAGHVIHQTRRLRIVMSPAISVPFSTRGPWRYYVVLPQAMALDRQAMEMSLGHELQHIRQGDVDAEVLLSLISPIVVLNPGYWFLSGRLRKLGELACDRAYLARRGFDAHSYAMRLLAIARRNRTARQPAAFGVGLVGVHLPFLPARSMLKQRILEMARNQARPTRETRVMGLILSLGVATCIMVGAVALAEPADWSHDRLMLSSVANLERLNQLNTMAQRSW